MIALALTVSLWQSGKVQPRNSEARFDSRWTQLPGSVPQSHQSDWCVVHNLTELFCSKARDVLTVDVVLVVIGLVKCPLIIINTEKITVFIVILTHKVLRCAHIPAGCIRPETFHILFLFDTVPSCFPRMSCLSNSVYIWWCLIQSSLSLQSTCWNPSPSTIPCHTANWFQ